MGHWLLVSVLGDGGESRKWVRRGQYLSVMKLSVHIDLSLCDEARQVWNRVGDVCKERHWCQCRSRSPPTQGHVGSIPSWEWVIGGGKEGRVSTLMEEQGYCTPI